MQNIYANDMDHIWNGMLKPPKKGPIVRVKDNPFWISGNITSPKMPTNTQLFTDPLKTKTVTFPSVLNNHAWY